MKRKIKKIKNIANDISKDRNIRVTTLSIAIGFVLGIASRYLMNLINQIWIPIILVALTTSIYKNIIIRKFKITEKGWSFGHIYWPVLITWFATWTFLINV